MSRLEGAPAADLDRYLDERLRTLLAHAASTTAHYRRALAACGWSPGQALTREHWARIPLLGRPELRAHERALLSDALPAVCGPYGGQHVSVQAFHQQAGGNRERRQAGNHAMRAIDVFQVFAACDQILGRSRQPADADAA